MKYCVLFILFLMNFHVSGQICEGNLGENIFTEGDFGTGIPNVVVDDPLIALGYMYTTVVAPQDGQYTLTNDISVWSTTFGWLEIGDNSNDPNGYMMVINCSYDPGLFYLQEIEGLCENTFYQFTADIINLIPPGINLIKPNVAFLIDDNPLYITGEIPESGEWNQYGFTFYTEPGQTSITLSLQNSAPGGNGNDIALDNIRFQPCGPEALILPVEIADICEDGSPKIMEATINGTQYTTPKYQWQQSFDEGITWENIIGANSSTYSHTTLSSGLYYYRYLLANDASNLLNSKCRVISNPKIINVIPKHYSVIDTICEGLEFNQGSSQYTTTGIYVDSLDNYLGCDSIITLDLTIFPDEGIEYDFETENPICAKGNEGSILINNVIQGSPPYIFRINGGIIIDAYSQSNLYAGIYTYLITDRYGCFVKNDIILEDPVTYAANLGPDKTVVLGDEVNVIAITTEETVSYQWIPELLLDCNPNCKEITFLPNQSSYVFVTAISDKGCIATDSIYIRLKKDRKVYFPNIFTPNADGINDKFNIFGSIPNIQEIETFKVYDRWGELLYEQNNFQPNENNTGWDGTFKNKKAGSGVYSYYAMIRFLDDERIVFSGSVSLVR